MQKKKRSRWNAIKELGDQLAERNNLIAELTKSLEESDKLRQSTQIRTILNILALAIPNHYKALAIEGIIVQERGLNNGYSA